MVHDVVKPNVAASLLKFNVYGFGIWAEDYRLPTAASGADLQERILGQFRIIGTWSHSTH